MIYLLYKKNCTDPLWKFVVSGLGVWCDEKVMKVFFLPICEEITFGYLWKPIWHRWTDGCLGILENLAVERNNGIG